MKKIFSIFASSVLALSMFVSCSGDLHNDMDPAKVALIMGETKTILDDAGIIGTINDWKNKDGVDNQGDALTKVDDTTYTYTFTAKGETEQFSIQEDREAKWTKPRWCGALKQDEDNAVKIEPTGEAAMVYSTDPNPSHFKLTGLTVGTTYKITVTIVDEDKKSLKAGVAVDGNAPVTPATPVSFYLDKFFVCGMMNGWVHSLDTILWAPTLDKTTGELTYQYDFTWSDAATEAEFGICTQGWSTKYTGATVAVGEDAVETELGAANSKVTGLTNGSSYRMEVITTPEKKVYAKVYEIAAYEIVFEIVNLEDVDYAWLNGGFFNGWKAGWPIAEWGTLGDGFDKSDIPEVSAGKAVFGEKFKVTGVAKPGETITNEVKFVATADDWATTAYDNSNISVDVEITGTGKYIVTIDASENEATVKKM